MKKAFSLVVLFILLFSQFGQSALLVKPVNAASNFEVKKEENALDNQVIIHVSAVNEEISKMNISLPAHADFDEASKTDNGTMTYDAEAHEVSISQNDKPEKLQGQLILTSISENNINISVQGERDGDSTDTETYSFSVSDELLESSEQQEEETSGQESSPEQEETTKNTGEQSGDSSASERDTSKDSPSTEKGEQSTENQEQEKTSGDGNGEQDKSTDSGQEKKQREESNAKESGESQETSNQEGQTSQNDDTDETSSEQQQGETENGGVTNYMEIVPFAGNLNVDVDISPQTETVMSGNDAAYNLELKVTGSRAEYTNAELTIDLPITSYTNFTQDPGELTIAGVTPVYDAENNQLIYEFDSIETGQTYESFIKVDTMNGVSPNNAELGATASFSADQQSSISDNATAAIAASNAVDISKSFQEVQGNDLNVPSPGARTLWDINISVPKNDKGQLYIKEGSEITVEDTLPSGLTFDGMETGPVPDQNDGTLTWTFDAPSQNQQENEDTELFSETIRVWLTVDSGTVDTTQENTASSSVTFLDDSTETVEGSHQIDIMDSEAANGEVDGSYYVPTHIGPSDGSGSLGSNNNKNPNPLVYDDALLGFRHGIAPLPESQHGDFQEYKTLYRVDDQLIFNKLVTPENFKYRPNASFPNDIPLEEDPVFNIKINVNGNLETVVNDAEKGQTYTREDLGLESEDEVNQIRYEFTTAPSGMLNGKNAYYYFDVEPGYTGEVENTFNVYGTDGNGDSFNYRYHEEDKDTIAGPRTAEIAPEPTDQPPTGEVEVELLENEGGEVRPGDNRMRIGLNTVNSSALSMEEPLETVTLLPPGVTLSETPNVDYINTDNETGASHGSYEVITDNYNSSGRQLVKINWNDGLVRPGNGLAAELDVIIADNAPTSLPFDVYGFSGDEELDAPNNDGSAVTDTTLQTDSEDLNGDGTSDEPRLKSGNEYIIRGQYDVQTEKFIKGELDDDYGAFGQTTPGGSIDYRLTLTNTSGKDISYMTLMDVMPSEGDLGITDNVERGSQFTPELMEAVTLPAEWQDKVRVYYSTEETPERDDLTRNTDYPETTEPLANPMEAEEPNWMTAGEVSDWNAVHSFKMELADDTQWIAGENITIEFSMQAPAASEVSEEVLDPAADPTSRAAWNSFALATDEGQPVEPSRVGVYMDYENSVELTKTGEDGQELPGAEFLLQDSAGDEIETGLTTGENGTITVEGLQPGDYAFIETNAPEDYELDDTPIPFSISVDQTEPVTLEKENSLAPGGVELTKTGNDGNLLEGVEFELLDEAGETLQEGLSTNEQGELTINDLAPGVYQFVETAAAPGYELNNTPLAFEIEAGQTETKQVAMSNQVIPGSVELTKVDDNGEALAEAEFKVLDEEGTEVHTNLTSGEDGTITVEDLDPGSYQFVETRAPENYELDETPIDFEIELNQQETLEITHENNLIPGTLELTKTGVDGELLEGVVFELQDEQGDTLEEGLTTEENGELVLDDLSPGNYQLVETETLEGYELDDTPIEFEIGLGQTERTEVEFSNPAIPGAVELKKTDENGDVLEDAEFELQEEDGTELQTGLTTDENGMLTVDDLAPGSYQFVETEAPEGYQLDDTPVEFEITFNQVETVQVTKENRPIPSSLELTKTGEDGELLEGVVFELKNNEGATLRDNLVTDEQGQLMVDGLIPGNYQLVEIETLEGYQLNATPIEFEIGLGQNERTEVEFTNELIPGAVGLTKTGEDGDNLEGAVFSLQDEEGEELETGLTTDENGVLSVGELTPGSYQFVETEAPEGYQLDESPIEFEIEFNQQETLQLTKENHYIPSSMELTKTGADGEVLEDVVFELQDSDGMTLQEGLTTDEDGKLFIGSLSPGSYQLVEKETVDGYELEDRPIEFDIGLGETETREIEFENRLTPGSVELTKVDEDDLDQTLEGAMFELQSGEGDVLEEGLTTDEEGMVVVNNLRPGSYQFVETKAPDGYQIDREPVSFEIERNQNEPLTLTVENDDPPTGGRSPSPEEGSITLIKITADGEELPLEGAVFNLEDAEGKVIEEGLTTDEYGEITVEDLEAGEYQFVETQAPDGYHLDDEPILIDLEDGEDSTVSVENEEIQGTVVLIKTAAENSDHYLENAVFDLETSDGELLEENLTTDEQGELSVTELSPGDYQFVETQAPEGYQLNTAPIVFEIADDQDAVVTLTAENEVRPGSVTLTKVDTENTENVLEGAVFDLETSDGDVLEESLRTGENGQLTVTDLEAGGYQFVEREAPNGYKRDDTPVPFQIEAGQTEMVQITVKNKADPGAGPQEPEGSVALTKVDETNTDHLLEGAVFMLQTEDGTTVEEELETNNSGKVFVNHLSPGTYQFVETKAPEGYELDETPVSFEIEEEQTEPVDVMIENKVDAETELPTVEEDASVILTKVDAENADRVLEGAVFELQNGEGETLQAELTTNESGKIVIKDLAAGSYQFVETKAPDGYNTEEEPVSFRIEDDQTEAVQVTIENTRQKERLPNTSTAIFNYGLAGVLALTAGLAARRKTKKKKG
ncbi:SpaA isopeptide-forming pilin-related protein [Salibacterium aidingense]|uniref:SpaA isopeptide-forming pilin-related protein n=1 Tax=Salibacterium aidingense TaxID=384933 RepID=UPI003BC64DA5